MFMIKIKINEKSNREEYKNKLIGIKEQNYILFFSCIIIGNPENYALKTSF